MSKTEALLGMDTLPCESHGWKLESVVSRSQENYQSMMPWQQVNIEENQYDTFYVWHIPERILVEYFKF